MYSFTEQLHPVLAATPATDAAGRTGAYVSMKYLHKLYIVFTITQGNAATIALSLSQATAVAGTSAKAVSATFPIYSNLDAAAGDTMVRRTEAASYTTDAGVKNKVVVFEIKATDLDVANSFDCVAPVTGASNAANITSCMFYGVPRYQGNLPASVVTD